LGLVRGTIRPGGAVAAQAHGDAGVAYARLAELPACPAINNLSGDVLGTDVVSLAPGTYCFDSSAQLTGILHLTGAGPWIFKIGSTLTTASNSSVVIDSPGQNCIGSNVFWQVGSSATLGTGTKFVGNILAHTSITATTGVTSSGSLIAVGGAVTMDTNMVNVCTSGSGFPGEVDKCKPRHHHGHGHHDGDDDDDDGDHDHDGDHHHKDKDHKDKDKDKDHKGNGSKYKH
jgi:hypothetical protein